MNQSVSRAIIEKGHVFGFELMPEEQEKRVEDFFFARGLVTLPFFLAKDQALLWAR